MKGWQQLRFYNPRIDAESIRISGCDDRGSEFWVCWPLAPDGPKRREQREKALEMIGAAIDAGLEPGEVISDE